jgi:hypothetical protein
VRPLIPVCTRHYARTSVWHLPCPFTSQKLHPCACTERHTITQSSHRSSQKIHHHTRYRSNRSQTLRTRQHVANRLGGHEHRIALRCSRDAVVVRAHVAAEHTKTMQPHKYHHDLYNRSLTCTSHIEADPDRPRRTASSPACLCTWRSRDSRTRWRQGNCGGEVTCACAR